MAGVAPGAGGYAGAVKEACGNRIVDDDAIVEPLRLWFRIALGSVFIWFVFGPVWSLFSIHEGDRDARRDAA